MRTCIPGTLLPLTEESRTHAFSVLEPVFAVSGGGLQLSQLTEMTGLSASTIQNWVKRGWVSKPVNKKYGPLQVARILLINLLRPAMQLDKIAALLGLRQRERRRSRRRHHSRTRAVRSGVRRYPAARRSPGNPTRVCHNPHRCAT